MTELLAHDMAETSTVDAIRSCFEFTVEATGSRPAAKFRDPIGINILRRVADRLLKNGFEVTNVKSGSACAGAFRVLFAGFSIAAIIVVQRSETGLASCMVMTWPVRRFWQRISTPLVSEGWECACLAMENALTQDGEVRSLRRLTKDQAETEWEQKGPNPTRHD